MASFTDLPPEMRNSIYDLLLTSSPPDLGMLNVSRQLHKEAASYFYQNNTFNVTFPSNGEGTAASVAVLPPIPDRALKYLRHLTVELCLNSSTGLQKYYAKRLDALINSGARIEMLSVGILSSASRFLSGRVDDTVLTASHPLTLVLRRLLTSKTAQVVRVELQDVWFAPGLGTALRRQFGERLEVLSTSTTLPSASESGAGAVERELVGCTTRSHLLALGLDEDEAMELLPSSPSSLGSALSELDQFSPIEYLAFDIDIEQEIEDGEMVTASMKLERADSFFDENFQDLNKDTGEEEELTEEDDVEDEEMLGVDDVEIILGNLGEVAEQRGAEKEMCYLTNFAPDILGRWIDGDAS